MPGRASRPTRGRPFPRTISVRRPERGAVSSVRETIMGTTSTWSGRRDRFRELHGAGLFVMPNPWDAGSARLLASLGFPALATTSSGHAASLGRADYGVTRDEMLELVGAVAGSVAV